MTNFLKSLFNVSVLILLLAGCGDVGTVEQPDIAASPTFPQVNTIATKTPVAAPTAINESSLLPDALLFDPALTGSEILYLVPPRLGQLEGAARPEKLFDDKRYGEAGFEIYTTSNWQEVSHGVENGNVEALIIHAKAFNEINMEQLQSYIKDRCLVVGGVGPDNYVPGFSGAQAPPEEASELFFNLKVLRNNGSGSSTIFIKTEKPLIYPSLQQHIIQGSPNDPCKFAEPPTPTAKQAAENETQFLQTVTDMIMADLTTGSRNSQTFTVTEDFFHGVYGVGAQTTIPEAALGELGGYYLGNFYGNRKISVAADSAAPLPAGVTFEQASVLSPSELPVDAIVYSTGWGLDQTAEALLYFTKQEPYFYFMGAILSFDGFTPPKPVAIADPSPAVLSFLEVEKVQAEINESLRANLQIDQQDVTINPARIIAVYTNVIGSGNENIVTIVNLNSGQRTDYETANDVQLIAREAVWLNDNEVLMGFRNEAFGEGPYWGPIAHLDTTNGTVTILEDGIGLRQPPFITADGAIVYANTQKPNLRIIQDGEVQSFSADIDSAPALSTDQRYLIGVGKLDSQANSNTYKFIDLQTSEVTTLLTFYPPGIGGYYPPAVWNDAGTWAAISPLTVITEQIGVTLVEAKSKQTIFLGIVTTNPRWVDSETLIFDKWINNQKQTYVFDIVAGEQSHLVVNP